MEAASRALAGLGCVVGRMALRGLRHMRRGGPRRKLGDASLMAKDIEQAGRALAAIPNTKLLTDGSPNLHSDSHDKVVGFIAAYIGAVGGDQTAIEQHLVPWLRQCGRGTATNGLPAASTRSARAPM